MFNQMMKCFSLHESNEKSWQCVFFPLSVGPGGLLQRRPIGRRGQGGCSSAAGMAFGARQELDSTFREDQGKVSIFLL